MPPGPIWLGGALLSAFLALAWPEEAELALIPAIAPIPRHTVAKAPHATRFIFMSDLHHFCDLAAAGSTRDGLSGESRLGV